MYIYICVCVCVCVCVYMCMYVCMYLSNVQFSQFCDIEGEMTQSFQFQIVLLKVWKYIAQGCNHQSIASSRYNNI